MLIDFDYTREQWQSIRQALITTRENVPESMVEVIDMILRTTEGGA